MNPSRADVMDQAVGEPRPAPTDMEMVLVERCRLGDRSAFHKIYQRHRSGVYAVVSRMVTNQADRDEVVQEVFLQVYRSIRTFHGTARLSTWIHRVAVNVTLQHIRSKGRRVKLHLTCEPVETFPDEPDRMVGSACASPEAQLLAHERRHAVEQALQALPPKKRIVLVLADFQGLSTSEVAEIVGAPMLTVRTRLFYARKAFYARIAKHPAFAGMSFMEHGS